MTKIEKMKKLAVKAYAASVKAWDTNKGHKAAQHAHLAAAEASDALGYNTKADGHHNMAVDHLVEHRRLMARAKAKNKRFYLVRANGRKIFASASCVAHALDLAGFRAGVEYEWASVYTTDLEAARAKTPRQWKKI